MLERHSPGGKGEMQSQQAKDLQMSRQNLEQEGQLCLSRSGKDGWGKSELPC